MRTRALLIALALNLSAPALSAAPSEGAALVAEHCTACHGTEVYTRPNHRVQDLAGLNAQVRRCDANLGLKLFDDDMESIVHYLNTHYYKF